MFQRNENEIPQLFYIGIWNYTFYLRISHTLHTFESVSGSSHMRQGGLWFSNTKFILMISKIVDHHTSSMSFLTYCTVRSSLCVLGFHRTLYGNEVNVCTVYSLTNRDGVSTKLVKGKVIQKNVEDKIRGRSNKFTNLKFNQRTEIVSKNLISLYNIGNLYKWYNFYYCFFCFYYWWRGVGAV